MLNLEKIHVSALPKALGGIYRESVRHVDYCT